MQLTISVPDYDREHGLSLKWESGHEITVRFEADQAIIRANHQGLVSLARHLLTLAQDQVPSGVHLHLDESNGLEPGSLELIIERAQ